MGPNKDVLVRELYGFCISVTKLSEKSRTVLMSIAMLK